MSMSAGSSKGGPMMDLNVTPLIDVLLVLLIIFMVITPVIPKGLDAMVPKPDKNPKPNKAVLERTIVVSIDANNKIAINTQPVAVNDLGTRLEDVFKNRPEHIMFIKGDPGLPFQDVAQVIDISKGAGADKIGLITKSIEAEQ